MDIPLTISETHKRLLDKEFSAVELVDAYLDRIKAFDKEVNAFITVTEERVYKDAKKTDEKITKFGKNAFSEYPLLGVTTAYKDLFLTKNVRTTAAAKVLGNYNPAYSATTVKRIEAAGSLNIGKTNCDAWAHGASGENSQFDPTKNPWSKKHVPGGSSSGSAAALASNFALVAMGTDTGGSTRQPANFCSVVGLKPTYGAISRYGLIAMASSLDTVGTFGHSVEDVEKMFKVIKGEDGKDATVKDSNLKSGSSKLRLGIPKEYFVDGIDREVEQSVLAASKIFKESGVELVDISLPHTKYSVSVYYIVMSAEVSSNLGKYDGVRYGNGRDAFGDEALRRIMLGTYVLSAGYYDAYYLKAMKVRSKLIEDFEKAFEKIDAILAPVSPTPPFKIGEKVSDPLQMYLADIFTAPANLAGIPSLAVPSGFTNNGLPLGFQLMGPKFSEHKLFELGKIYEKASGWKPRVAPL